MKFVYAFTLGILHLLSGPALSQPAIDPLLPNVPAVNYEMQRARIESQRNSLQTQFDQAAVLCYQRFAVNDCLQVARNARRDRLAELRLQSLTVRDAQARRRAAERLQDR